jgi:hypothetical protein
MISNSEEISLIVVLRRLWQGLKKIVLIAFGVILLLTLSYFTTPKEWTASNGLLMTIGSKSNPLSGLGSLAGLGSSFKIGNDDGIINPLAYSDILFNDYFLITLLDSELESADGRTVRDYLLNDIKRPLHKRVISFPMTALSALRGSSDQESRQSDAETGLVTISDARLFEVIKQRIIVAFDENKNIYSVLVEMQKPEIAAEIVSICTEYLDAFVSSFYVKKERRRLEFLKEKLDEADRAYYQSSQELAKFRDTNRNLATYSVKNELFRLNFENENLFSIYSGLLRSYQEAEISVEDKNEVFQPIGPVYVPVKQSNSGLVMTLLIAAFLGVMIGVVYVLSKDRVVEIFNEIKGR